MEDKLKNYKIVTEQKLKFSVPFFCISDVLEAVLLVSFPAPFVYLNISFFLF